MKAVAAFMQGYVALEGFGITLIKNHTVDIHPTTIKTSIAGNLLFFTDSIMQGYEVLLLPRFFIFRSCLLSWSNLVIYDIIGWIITTGSIYLDLYSYN